MRKPVKIRRANKERICYKVLEDKDGQLLSPFMQAVYGIGKEIKLGVPLEIRKRRSHYFVTEGLHLFSDVDKALNLMVILEHCGGYRKYVVAECRIPKRAHYIKSGDYYVSDTVVVGKVKYMYPNVMAIRK